MAKSLGTLVAGLVLDTSRWSGGFQKAGKDAKQFTGMTGLANRSISAVSTSMMSMAAGALSATAAVNTLRTSFSTIDRQAKLADRLGITMEATQKLGHAASLSGTNLEDLAKAMLKMNRTIGTGGMALDKRFLQVATDLSKIEDAGRRASEAFRIFGRRGEEVLNLLAQGGPNILKSAETLERMGLLLSRADARQVEAANDALTELGAVLRGIANRIAVELAPATKSWADQAVSDIDRIGKALRELGARWGVIGTPKKDGILDLLLRGPKVDRLTLAGRTLTETPGGSRLGGLPGAEFFRNPLTQASERMSRLATMWREGPGQLFPASFSPTLKAADVAGGDAGPMDSKLKPGSFERGSIEAVRLLQNIEGGNPMNAVAKHTSEMLREIRLVRENTEPSRNRRRVVSF